MRAVDVTHDGRDFLRGLLATDSGLQSSNHPEPVIVDRGHVLGRFLVVDRKKDLHFLFGEGEPTRHHTEDGVGLHVKIDFAADDGSVAAEVKT